MNGFFGVNGEIDYSKWQRKSLSFQRVTFTVPRLDEDGGSGLMAEGRRASVNRSRDSAKDTQGLFKERAEKNVRVNSGGNERRYSVIDSPVDIFTRAELESACSSRCRHLPKLNLNDTKVTESFENVELIRTIKFQIKAKCQCILEYKKQILNLINENVKLKKEIQDDESGTHDHVTLLLEKYHKLRGAMGRISQEHVKQKTTTEKSFREVKALTEHGLSDLNERLNHLHAELLKQQNEIRTLNNYKNKEYPEKVLRINNLKKELEMLQMLLKRDMKEMDEIIEVEVVKYQENATSEEFAVINRARSQIFDMMDAGVKETAMQNMRLKREIEIQKSEKKKLELENLEIERKIKKLMEKKNEIRRKKYPGLFQSTEKCLPDTEIELSIPKKQFIPI